MIETNIQKIIDNLTQDITGGFGELTLLCDKYGSDKGSYYNVASSGVHAYPWLPHTYCDVYEVLFKKLRYKKLNIFECGIGTNNPQIASNMTINGRPGASLRVWRDYFVNSNIYGADVDKNCLFEENRIKTGWIDQLNSEAIYDYFNNFGVNFDIMIDDGLHCANAAITLFKHATKFLCKGGIYVIEDLNLKNIFQLQEFLATQDGFTIQYAMMCDEKRGDNNLIICHKMIS